MLAKIVVFTALVASISALEPRGFRLHSPDSDNHNSVQHIQSAPTLVKYAPVAYAAPVAKYVAGPAYLAHQEEIAHPKYEYAYSVEDHHTGDSHNQQEQRDGDHVVGQYSLHEADGTVRIVKYYDDGHGFNAVVERQGTHTEAPVALKKVVVPLADAHYY